MFSEFFGHYVHSRKRFDRFTRMLTSGILNIGHDSVRLQMVWDNLSCLGTEALAHWS
jgi:hypothetical protein